MKARRRTRNKKPVRAGLGVLRLVGVGLLLTVIGYFLNDFYSVPFGFVGAYVWAAAFLLAFLLGMFYLAQHVLPLPPMQSWFEAQRLAFRYNFPILAGLSQGQVALGRPAAAREGALAELAPGFAIHRAGILDSHRALALRRGLVFTRPAGPGYINLGPGEGVLQVIDLRRHHRNAAVKAMSRDGIPFETSVDITFQVKQAEQPADPDLPYPYEGGVIFDIVSLSEVGEGNGNLGWTELICREAADLLHNEFLLHTLDELFELDPSKTPRLRLVREKVEKELQARLEARGVTIHSVGIGPFTLPEDVAKTRHDFWKTRWQERIRGELAAADAEAERQIKLARARAQIRIIERITNSIVTMRNSGRADLPEIVALRLIDALEETAADDAVQALLPAQAMSSLRQINSLIRDWGEDA